jgi:hypothetical protein
MHDAQLMTTEIPTADRDQLLRPLREPPVGERGPLHLEERGVNPGAARP